MCRSALKFLPPVDVSHTSMIGIYRVNVGGLFNSSHHTSSPLIQYKHLRSGFRFTHGKKDEVAVARVSTQV